eukprot:29813-Pelagococcus_subviridis.AAC.1
MVPAPRRVAAARGDDLPARAALALDPVVASGEDAGGGSIPGAVDDGDGALRALRLRARELVASHAAVLARAGAGGSGDEDLVRSYDGLHQSD